MTDATTGAAFPVNRMVTGWFVNALNQTIGYFVEIDFPDTKAIKVNINLEGLVYNGLPVRADPKPVIVVQVTFIKMDRPPYEQPGNFHAKLNTGAFKGPTIELDTRTSPKYDLAKLAQNPGYQDQLKKGLIGFAATVNLIGTGPNKTDGLDHIKLGWVQDIQASFVARYAPNSHGVKGTASFKPMWNKKPLTGWLLDSVRTRNGATGTGGSTAFTNSSTEVDPRKDLPGGGKSSIVVSLDAPGIEFLKTHPNTGTEWVDDFGGFNFKTYLTAYTIDAPDEYAVYGNDDWQFHPAGRNDGNGNWVQLSGTSVLQNYGFFHSPPGPAPGETVSGFTATAPTFTEAISFAGDVTYTP